MKFFWVLGFFILLLAGCTCRSDLNWTEVVFDGEVAVGGPALFVPLTLIQSAAAKGADSFNLLVNNGTAAGQVIFHTHFHIIPRRAGDQLWPSEGHRQPIKQNEETLNLVSRIRERISPQPTACCSTLESQLHKNLHD